MNLEMLGIPDLKLPEIFEPQADEDSVPEHVEPRTKLGDVYSLGRHRLMCGDSTSIDAVEKLMNGDIMDICFTSPPYNAAKDSHLNGRVSGFENKYSTNTDCMDDGDYRDFLSGFTSIAIEKCKFVFVNLQLLSKNRIPLVEYQYQFRGQIKDILIWNKRQCPPNIVKGAL